MNGPAGRDSAVSLHAGCVVLGEAGLLIRGPSGAGKSSLGRRIVALHRAAGGFARIVADDRVLVTLRHGRLIGRPDPALAGVEEIRGLGIRAVDHEPAAVLRLIVDLVAEPPSRMPEAADLTANVLGIPLPRIAVRLSDAADVVNATLSWQARHGDDLTLSI
ncbi:HPr kinase/phosphorylase [Enterovirga rhinocerotis]|uniref:HPr serine kinase-like protein n=1 Tax=Enterovirga rhinocerotis TaxID=1339210 RepID=A0A4R7CBP3_9HYPH|nr:hypothetical protein [Enterovirga rhinocerotis]TDR94865.1 HPr serine kinase-like protein [Enterovirga rhinocerotis]